MIIKMIKMHQGELTAICDNGEGYTLDRISGQIMPEAELHPNGDGTFTARKAVDESCVNGICSYQPPQGK